MYSLIALPATETTRSGRGCRRPTRRCSSTRRPSSRWLYYVTKRPAAGCSVQRRAVGLAIAASQATTPGGGTWNAGQGRWKNRGGCGAGLARWRCAGVVISRSSWELGVGAGRWGMDGGGKTVGESGDAMRGQGIWPGSLPVGESGMPEQGGRDGAARLPRMAGFDPWTATWRLRELPSPRQTDRPPTRTRG
jgi:hypothetical protein